MSFQDVGRNNNTRRQPANATFGSKPATSAGTGSSAASTSSKMSWGNSPASISQISESLTQYQRNVGILEKIAQQLLTTTAGSARSELEQQYHVQCDVLQQLEQKVRDLLLAQRRTGEQKQALTKLERDFERVQGLATSAKAKVTRQQKQWQQRNAAALDQPTTQMQAMQQEQQQFQIQLQQDKLHEEIMREREQEIRNINQGMHTVNEIYKDLAHIVGSQQEQVDQIENQMEDARDNATSGLEQVQKANEKYNQSQCVLM
eukprot:Nitzschia sp. Nitz4//scaffold215_size37433//7169//8134//NITZ4_007746-RA/size37433-augustus-gene-0.34-mRNA-1//-1//CDS//3329542136//6877//frame0